MSEKEIIGELIHNNKLSNEQLSKVRTFIQESIKRWFGRNNNIEILEPVSLPGKYLSAPLAIDLYPTFICNANCDYCYLPKDVLVKTTMTFNEAKIIADKCIKAGVGEIDILGGEPFLWNDLLYYLEYLSSKNIFATVTTNGIFKGQDFVKPLCGLRNITINFSVLGAEAETHDRHTKVKGSFSKLVENLSLFLANKINVAVGITATLRNKEEITQIINNFSSKGIKEFGIRIFTPTGTGFLNRSEYQIDIKDFWRIINEALKLKKIDKLLSICGLGGFYFLAINNPLPIHDYLMIKTSFCGAGNTKFDVYPNGRASPCVMFPFSRDLGDERNNLLNNHVTIKTFWESEIMHSFRQRSAPAECISVRCKYTPVCKGGCPAVTAWAMYQASYDMLTFQDVFNVPDPRCPILQGKT